jgi:hypothetical protein
MFRDGVITDGDSRKQGIALHLPCFGTSSSLRKAVGNRDLPCTDTDGAKRGPRRPGGTLGLGPREAGQRRALGGLAATGFSSGRRAAVRPAPAPFDQADGPADAASGIEGPHGQGMETTRSGSRKTCTASVLDVWVAELRFVAAGRVGHGGRRGSGCRDGWGLLLTHGALARPSRVRAPWGGGDSSAPDTPLTQHDDDGAFGRGSAAIPDIDGQERTRPDKLVV